MLKAKYCQYCGILLSEKCDCHVEIGKSHLFDFLLVEHSDDCMMSYSEERAMLEYAEHRMG